jgi:hypothetical protein
VGLRNWFMGCMAKAHNGFEAVHRRLPGWLCLQPCPATLAPDNSVVDCFRWLSIFDDLLRHACLDRLCQELCCGCVRVSAGCLSKPKHSPGSRPGRTARHLSSIAT